jgi:hypothetical protein
MKIAMVITILLLVAGIVHVKRQNRVLQQHFEAVSDTLQSQIVQQRRIEEVAICTLARFGEYGLKKFNLPMPVSFYLSG